MVMSDSKSVRVLTLNLKAIYYVDIITGKKDYEYRLYTDYWKKRLVGREYDCMVICLGYPKKDDWDRKKIFPYSGYEIQTINHPHFGPDDVEVFAIKIGQVKNCKYIEV